MRLAQIARKVKAKPTEIRAFVKTKFGVELDKDPNIKLDDDQVDAIIKKFKVAPEPKKVVVKKEVVEKEEEIEIDPTIDTDIESLKEVAEVVAAKIEIPEIKKEEVTEEPAEKEAKKEAAPAKKKAVTIKHASPEEFEKLKAEKNSEEAQEFNAVAVDEDAELIAAEVEQLPGLKVLGKIELADDKETKKLLEEEVALPDSDAIETEIDDLDGEVDTSEFTDLSTEEPDPDKDAIFAELDAAMEGTTASMAKIKPVDTPKEVKENTEVSDEEDSIYKDARGIYHFSSEQKANRIKSLALKKERKRAQIQKEKKQRYYKEQVAAKVAPKKKKSNPKKQQTKAKKEAQKADEPTTLWGKFKRWLND